MGDLPPGFTLDDVPKGFTVDTASSSAPGAYDDKIKHYASKYSVDPKIFRNLIQTESSFNPHARSAAGAMGLGQLMPDTAAGLGVKNPYDPDENLDASARYLAQNLKRYGGDYMRTVASYNAGPGNVDKHGVDALKVSGADPDYLKKILGPLGYLNRPIVSAASAAEAPPPPGYQLDQQLAAGAQAVSGAPQKSVQHSPLDQIIAIPDAMFILGNSSFRGDTPEARRASTVKALTMFVHDPAAANDEYGLGAKPQLDYEQAHGIQGLPGVSAGFWLAHPKVTAAVAGGAEFINPGQALAGEGVGRGLNFVAHTAPGMKLLSVFENMTSPLKGFKDAGGQEGKRAMQALLVRVAGAPAHAQSMALHIFGGLDKMAQEDVVHSFQGQNAAIKTTDPTKLAEIYKRADLLRKYTDDLTQGQVKAGTLKEGTAEANPDHFGMGGAYKNPHLTPEQEKVFERGSVGGGGITREGSEQTQAQYRTLHEAQTSAKAPLKDDFHVVLQAERNFAHALRNTAFEDAAKDIPSTLLKKDAPYSKLNPPKDGAGHDMVHFKDIQENDPALAKFLEFSPTLNKSYMSNAMYEYLKKNSTRLYDSRPLYETFNNPVARLALKGWDGLNNGARMAIVSNPFFHPVWNLSNNAVGAGLPLHEAASLVTKSIVNTLGGGRAVDWFEKRVGHDWTKGLDDAIKAGAVADMKTGSSDATRRLASQWGDLDGPGKIGKLVDSAVAWNSRMTFGKRGEQAFSVALYKHLMKSGRYSEKEAGGLVREALGNYQNVAKDSFQNHLIFFYPWLKGNMPFWLRNLATNPKTIAAPQRGARVNNALVGDPNEDGQGRAKDFQFTEGNARDGFSRGTLPIPQRMVTDALDIGASGDPEKATKTAVKVVAGRAVPLVGAGIDAGITAYSQAKDPNQPQNYNTIYDKDAPGPTKARQIAGYAAGRAPIPLIGYQVKDAIREGKFPDVGSTLAQGLTGIQTHPETTNQDYKKEGRIRRQFESQVAHAKKSKDPDTKKKKLEAAYTIYTDRIKALDKATGRRHDTGLPPGFSIDAPPAGFTVDK